MRGTNRHNDCQHLPSETSNDQDPASNWLCAVTKATMHTYVENILRIPELTNLASKQLVADIGKICEDTSQN